MDSKTLTHLNEQGEARMVDVGDKEITARRAVAQGRIVMQPSTLDLIATGGTPRAMCWQSRASRRSWQQSALQR